MQYTSGFIVRCCVVIIWWIPTPKWVNLFTNILEAWWRHQMETFSALLAICAGISPVPGEFPAQKPVTRRFDVSFDLRLNKRLSKQSWGWWFEALSRPLRRHRNGLRQWRIVKNIDIIDLYQNTIEHIIVYIFCDVLQIIMLIQCCVIITRPFCTNILTISTPYLTHTDEIRLCVQNLICALSLWL